MVLLHSVACVIFDMDGLLLDTETSYTVAQEEIARRFGKTFDWKIKAQMMGKKALEAADVFISELGLHGLITANAFLSEREVILDRLFAQAQLMPGAERLIEHLSSSSIPIGLATSSHRRHFELKTSKHTDLFKLFDVIVTGDEVSRGKPDPEIFLLALEKLNASRHLQLTPNDCLVFEDAPSGVEAALTADMKVIMVPDPNLDESLRGKAHLDIWSLEHFKPEEWALKQFD